MDKFLWSVAWVKVLNLKQKLRNKYLEFVQWLLSCASIIFYHNKLGKKNLISLNFKNSINFFLGRMAKMHLKRKKDYWQSLEKIKEITMIIISLIWNLRKKEMGNNCKFLLKKLLLFQSRKWRQTKPLQFLNLMLFSTIC